MRRERWFLAARSDGRRDHRRAIAVTDVVLESVIERSWRAIQK